MTFQGQLPHRGQAYRLDQGGDENVFPLLRGQGFPEKSPNWGTTVLKSKSGRTFRKQNYSYPVWMFTVKYNTVSVRRNDLARINVFFNKRAGQFGIFDYLDPVDFRAVNQPFATGDGETKIFQIQRGVNYGDDSWLEPIFALQTPFKIYSDGVEKNHTYLGWGKVQLGTAPPAGAVISWTGTFLFRCRFTQDDLPMQQMNKLLYSSEGLSFETVRP